MNTETALEHIQTRGWIQSDTSALPPNADWQSMLAKEPVFVEQSQMEAMLEVIDTLSRLSEMESYRDIIKTSDPRLGNFVPTNKGVFYGYDFHLDSTGVKLIEVNTNAGAAYLNHHLQRSQKACCSVTEPFMQTPITEAGSFESQVLAMFRQEFRSPKSGTALKTVAIIDHDPQTQFLFPEFEMFKRLFESAGIRTLIADPKEASYHDGTLKIRNQAIDLIYNRHTDFYLESDSMLAIRKAYEQGAVVLTPNPYQYALVADKARFVQWSRPDFLEQFPLNQKERERLLKAIPHTEHVTSEKQAQLWASRKQLFFKPMNGYGSKASYKGSKLTRKTFDKIIEAGNYVAQELIEPSQHTLHQNGRHERFKLDVRLYVYDRAPIMAAGRLFRGQTTNLKTEGGGFATLYQLNTQKHPLPC